MKFFFTYLLCLNAITLSLTTPQYATQLPQFSQLSPTPYTVYGQNTRIWPWAIFGYAYPNYQYNANYWTNNNNNDYNPYSYPYSTNYPYNSFNIYNPFNQFNPNNLQVYNPYNQNTGTNTYWNGFAWVNSFRSTRRNKK